MQGETNVREKRTLTSVHAGRGRHIPAANVRVERGYAAGVSLEENEELWTSLRLADGQIESYDHVEIACPFVAKKVETACSFPVVSSVGMLHSHHLDVER